MKNLVFYGNERLVTGIKNSPVACFLSLLENQYTIEALILSSKSKNYKDVENLEVYKLAKKNNIKIELITQKSEILEVAKKYTSNIAVLASFGQIIPKDVIDYYENGIINIHPSLLPLHRGPTPIENALLHGENTTGVSIMKLDAGMDNGDIFDQEKITIESTDNSYTLAHSLDILGAKILIRLLPEIINKTIAPKPQNESLATFSKMIKKADIYLDQTMSAQQIVNHIKAYYCYPKTTVTINSKTAIIHHVILTDDEADKKSSEIIIFKNNKLYLNSTDYLVEIKKLQPLNAKVMDSHSFINGYLKK